LGAAFAILMRIIVDRAGEEMQGYFAGAFPCRHIQWATAKREIGLASPSFS